MAKDAKPAQEAAAPAAPKKSKKKLILIVLVILVLVLGGAAAAFILLKPAHPPGAENKPEHEVKVEKPAAYVELGTFTANLVHEEGDRYLQTAISLKITNPELTEKIKTANPEILHRVNMLLQSKRPSELSSYEGKQKLADQIKAQVEFVLGLRKGEPLISEEQNGGETVPVHVIRTDVAEVLFTSFIIQ